MELKIIAFLHMKSILLFNLNIVMSLTHNRHNMVLLNWRDGQFTVLIVVCMLNPNYIIDK